MSELGEVRAMNVVASGNGWVVGITGSSFHVDVHSDGDAKGLGLTLARTLSADKREQFRNDMRERVSTDLQRQRVDEAFAAPWIQA